MLRVMGTRNTEPQETQWEYDRHIVTRALIDFPCSCHILEVPHLGSPSMPFSIRGFWFQNPLKAWYLEPETPNLGYVDRLSWIGNTGRGCFRGRRKGQELGRRQVEGVPPGLELGSSSVCTNMHLDVGEYIYVYM